ncbi:MAG: hypothetical protein V5A55_05885 [Halovenus sp.]
MPLTVPQLRQTLDRAAGGESVDTLAVECRENSVHPVADKSGE